MTEKTTLAGGAVLAALAASACCIGPALLAALGAGSIGAGSVLVPYRPYFFGLALLLVGLALWRAYRNDATCCLTEPGRKQQRLTRLSLWVVSGITLSLLLYPNIVARVPTTIRPSSSTTSAGSTAVYAIPTMDCPACASSIERRLKEYPGILSARVDYGTKQAVVQYNPQKVHPNGIKTAIDETGFPAKLINTGKNSG